MLTDSIKSRITYIFMESLVTHDECVGFDATFGSCFVDSSTFCILAGNFIHICRFADRTMEILGAINGDLTGFSAMTASPLAHVLAYADSVQNPMIHIVDGNGLEQGSFTVSGILGVSSLEFSYDAQYLFTLGGLPTFRLSVFDWKKREELYHLTFDKPIGKHISVCPAKSQVFAVFGDADTGVPTLPSELDDDDVGHLRFYTLQGCGENYALGQVIAEVSDNVICMCWSPNLYRCYVGTCKGEVLLIDAITGKLVCEPLAMNSLGDGQQNASAMLCTSKYLLVSGTSGNIYWIDIEKFGKTDDMGVIDMTAPLAFMHMMPGKNSLFFGTDKNALMTAELDGESHKLVEGSIINLRDAHRGAITSCVCLPHHLVTAGHDGSLRFWTFSPFVGLTQSFSFGSDVLTVVAASPGGQLVAVGSQSGIVRIINTQDPAQPVLLFRERLHQSAVTSIVLTSSYICSGSLAGSVVIQKLDITKLFPLVGLLQMKTSIVSLAVPPPLGAIPQLLVATNHREIIRIDIPDEPTEDFKIIPSTLNRAMLKVSNKIMGIETEPSLREDQQYFYCACDDKSVKYYCMPITTGDLDIVGVDDVECSAPDDVFVAHTKAVTICRLSPNQQFVASGCAGATIIVREMDVSTAQTQSTAFTAIHHNPYTGAISDICFAPDGRKFFTVGFDGVINMYGVKVQPTPLIAESLPMPGGAFKISISRVFGIDQQITRLGEIWAGREYQEGDEDGFQADDGAGWEETPLILQIKSEQEKIREEEVRTYQSGIRDQIAEIQTEFMALVKENEDAPELEKLSTADFTLDMAAADRLKQLGVLRAQLVHYRRRVKNQIRSLMSQAITDKCFKAFEPRLTTCFSFKTPVKFDNFPLPIPDEKTKRRYEIVSILRRNEIAAVRYKAAGNDPNRVAPSNSRDSTLDGSRYLSSRSNSLVRLTSGESEVDLIVRDDIQLLYDPFQIVTANRKVTQLHIVQNVITEAMGQFNNEFDEMLTKKVNLVQALEEKNKRIRQLIKVLRLNAEDYVIFDPQVEHDETPESFMTVRDEEVVLRKQLEEGDKKAEQTDELEKDSFGERALREMMGGNINVDGMDEAPDDDEPARPEWMDQKKKEELTEEEAYQIQEFDKKLKNFIEEREKRRKALSAELVKLVKGNQSSVEEFDRQVAVVYMHRFDTEERVAYHELELLYLIDALNNEHKFRTELNQVSFESITDSSTIKQKENRLAQLMELSTQLSEIATTAETNLSNLRSQVDKEFQNKDCKVTLRRMFESMSKRVVPKVHPGPNIFQAFVQGPLVFTDDRADVQQNQPASLAEGPWRNFLEYCDRKVNLARDAAEKGLESADMKTIVKAYEEEIEKMRVHVEALGERQSELSDKLLNTRVDMHVPFTFRQGQVEIASDIVLVDYTDVVLIDKKVVMDRNALIEEAGRRKLAELEKIRKQRSDHKVLKWEIEKFVVEVENLDEEVREYQLFRGTKLDRELINGGGKNRNQSDVNSLNNSLQHTQKTHVIRMQRAKESLAKLKSKIKRKNNDNAQIEEEILQMQISLKERKRIYKIQTKSKEGASEARKGRLKQVMMISRLKRGKQVQDGKIQELQAEVARLRQGRYAMFKDEDQGPDVIGYQG